MPTDHQLNKDFEVRLNDLVPNPDIVPSYIELSIVKAFLAQELAAALERGKAEERTRVKSQIGFLRQWFNELQPNDGALVSNFDIEQWLFGKDIGGTHE